MNTPFDNAAQMQTWHDGGLFMGMHWLWWLVWIGTVAVLGWAFLRLFADRRVTRERVVAEEQAEASLRRRFAAGEITEEELKHGLQVLRETTQGR